MLRPSRALPLAALTLLAAACGTGPVPTDPSLAVAGPRAPLAQVRVVGPVVPDSPAATPSPQPLPELPRGGRSIFPRHTVVMHYGTAGTGVLGVLGETDPDTAALRLLQQAIPYQPTSGRPVLPAFELITTVAQARPGADGKYTSYLAEAEVQRYLEAARRARMLLVLDFQPGRAEFLEQVQRYERFLLEPEVGVALDPEWKLTPEQLPLRQIGGATALEVNAVSSYLANLTLENRLPEKLFIVHQFKATQLRDRAAIVDRPGLATVLHVDGFGGQQAKRETYGLLHSRDGQFVNGFKLFYDEDVDLMTPAEAMAVVPRPELISYQ